MDLGQGFTNLTPSHLLYLGKQSLRPATCGLRQMCAAGQSSLSIPINAQNNALPFKQHVPQASNIVGINTTNHFPRPWHSLSYLCRLYRELLFQPPAKTRLGQDFYCFSQRHRRARRVIGRACHMQSTEQCWL